MANLAYAEIKIIANDIGDELLHRLKLRTISKIGIDDMYAVLRAWLAKNEAIASKLDKIDDAPPTERRQ